MTRIFRRRYLRDYPSLVVFPIPIHHGQHRKDVSDVNAALKSALLRQRTTLREVADTIRSAKFTRWDILKHYKIKRTSSTLKPMLLKSRRRRNGDHVESVQCSLLAFNLPKNIVNIV